MFLWMELPSDIDVMKLFDIANKKNVAFVPGALYISKRKSEFSKIELY